MAFEKYTKPPSQRNTSDTKPVGNFKTGMKRAVLDEPKAKFFQHEAGEVVDVILNSSHPDFMKMSDIGSCKIRLLDSEFALPKAQLNWYRCVETNIKEYPLVGEYVVAVKYMGKFYWTHKINLLGSINNNAMFHFTTGNKLDNVMKELNYLEPLVEELDIPSHIINNLRSVNRKLWEVEDLLRVCEKEKCFDEGFITLARSVYKTNNERFELKREINTITNSHLIEEKIHP